MAWSIAENTKTTDAWDEAASAYERELDGCTEDCREFSHSIAIARVNAMRAAVEEPPPGDEPAPVPARVQSAVDALDRDVAMADPTDPEVAGERFLAANILRQWRQPDAIPRLEVVLRDYRSHQTAEYAANQLIDAYLRANRMDDLKALVTDLLADAAFLLGKDELRATLERVRLLLQ